MANPCRHRGIRRGPISAGFSGHYGAITLAAREDVVLVGGWRASPLSVYHGAFFVEEKRVITNGLMQFRQVRRNHCEVRIVPRPGANPIFGMYRRTIPAVFDAEVCVPSLASGPDRGCEVLTLFVCRREAAQIPGCTARARNEKAHGHIAASAAAASSARSRRAAHSAVPAAHSSHTSHTAGVATAAATTTAAHRFGTTAATAAVARGRGAGRISVAARDSGQKIESEDKSERAT